MKKSTIYDDADRLMAIDEVAERLKTSPTNIAKLINNKCNTHLVTKLDYVLYV